MNYDPNLIIKARILDITIGSLFGLLGGAVMHWKPLREVLEKVEKKVIHKWIGAE